MACKLQKFLLLLFFIPFLGSSQTIEWENTIGGNENDWLSDVFLNSKGNYILSGYSYSNISGDKTENTNGLADYWIIAQDPNGSIVWQMTFGGSFTDQLVKTLEMPDGGYLLAGYSNSDISGDKAEDSRGQDDLWLIRLDASRNILWQKTIGGNNVDRLVDINLTSDGGFIVGATSNSDASGEKVENNIGDTDLWLLKLNDQGDIEWQKTYGGDKAEVLSNIEQLADGGYIVGSHSSSGISGNKSEASRGLSDYWILRLDSSGNINWEKTYGGNNADFFVEVLPTLDGGFLLAGDSFSTISGEKTVSPIWLEDFWIIKVNSLGEIIWQNVIGGNSIDWLMNVEHASDGGYILGGLSYSGISGNKTEANRGDRDYWIVKITNLGLVCWDKTVGGNDNDTLTDILVDGGDNILAGGWTDSNSSGDKNEDLIGGRDFWTVKINQPFSDPPIANPLIDISTCDPDRDGFADDFDTSLVEETVIGDQTDVFVTYFDEQGNELPNPLPNPFTNTIKNQQLITVRVTRIDNLCEYAETELKLRISECEAPKPLEFPKFFTPNRDGYNDFWKMIPETAIQLDRVHIFDRYGKLLKEIDPNGPGWDGTFTGVPMPSDDYWFSAVLKDDRIQTGHFSLVRGN